MSSVFNQFTELDMSKKILLGSAAALIGVVAFRSYFLAKKKKRLTHPAYYGVCLPAERPGETEIHRSHLLGKDEPLKSVLSPKRTTLYENFYESAKQFADLPCLGTRNSDGPFEWETYAEVLRRVTNLGSGLVELGLEPGSMIGICSVNCAGWVIAEQAGNAYSLVTVPLYDTFGEEAIAHIINQCEIKVAFAHPDKIPLLLNCAAKCPTLQHIIYFGTTDLESSEHVKLLSLKEVEELGARTPHVHRPPAPHDVATICYTSGTTGMPKGVILTHGNLIADCAGVTLSGNVFVTDKDVHLSYLPLAHMFERLVILAMINGGAAIGFFRGDIQKHLFSDIQELRPTIFPSVPKLFSRIYDKVQLQISDAPAWKRHLFHMAVNSKIERLHKEGDSTHWFYDRLIFNKIKALLGGRVRVMITGSAPISPKVLEFMRICFSCEIHEGYGQTECTAACSASIPGTVSTGNVGCALPCSEIKLVDVPDMNFLVSDNPPRGEICVRGPNVFKGYFKNPEQTAEALDEHGWLHTGDVGTWLPDGTLKIIDRKKNIFKLAQGEYIAPEKIENVLVRSKFVAMLFIYGNSLKSSLVCVVVPDPDVTKAWAKENLHIEDASMEDLCGSEALKKVILDDMVRVGRANKLHGFEIPRAVYLEPNMFTPESDIVTPTLKLKRPVAQRVYQQAIDEMYASLNE